MLTANATGTTEATITSYTDPASAAGPTAPSLLPDPAGVLMSSGDVGAELAAFAVENGVAERSLARDERQAAEARELSEDDQEVHAIRAEASSLRAQAWVDAGTTLGAQLTDKSSSTGAALLTASKSLADAYFAAGQKDDEANAKACAAASTDAKSAADDAHDALAGANDCIRSALDFYQEYASTRAQTLIVAAQKA